MATVGPTADEPSYFVAGRLIRANGWENAATRLQGPLPFYANQLFAADEPVLDQSLSKWTEADDRTLLLGRLGMLPFAWLCAIVLFTWARRLFGNEGALFALALFALHPVIVGYSGLLAVDMSHSALVLLALFALFRYSEAPGHKRALLVGLALGAALATKYLVLLTTPVFAAVVAGKSFARVRRSGKPFGVALGDAALTTLLVATATIVTLHASYGFAAGFADVDPASYSSRQVTRALNTPVLRSLVGFLPRPFALGVDFQMSVGDVERAPYLDGRYAPGHRSFYVWTLVRKTPEWIGALVALALAWGAWAGLRGRGSTGARNTALVLVPTALLSLVYLSFFATLQAGMRYILPVVPMAILATGGLVHAGFIRGRSLNLRMIALALIVVGSLGELRLAWPDLIGYYNASSGVRSNAYRAFRGSNSSWGQYRSADLSSLCPDGHADTRAVPLLGGPRFGCLAFTVDALAARDPEDGSRSYHWVLALEATDQPVARLGGAWFLFHSTPSAWEVALDARPSSRARAELAIAFLADGDVEEFRRQAAQVDAPRRALLENQLAEIEAATDPDASIAVVARAARGWADYGRHDLAVSLLREHPNRAIREHRGFDLLLARELAMSDQPDEAARVLETSAQRATVRNAQLLSRIYSALSRHEDALRVLEDSLAFATANERPALEEDIERIRPFAVYMLDVRPLLKERP